MFNFSFSSILASLIFSTIGFAIFRHGRKNQHSPLIIIGVIMMAYTYFTNQAWQDWVIGLILSTTAYFIKDYEF